MMNPEPQNNSDTKQMVESIPSDQKEFKRKINQSISDETSEDYKIKLKAHKVYIGDGGKDKKKKKTRSDKSIDSSMV